MKLLEEMLMELHRKTKERNEMKLRNIAEIKKSETDAKIQKLRKKTERGQFQLTRSLTVIDPFRFRAQEAGIETQGG